MPGKEDDVFAQRMPGALQVVVGREEKALKVPDEHVVEREQRVKKQRIDVLEPVQRRAGFMGRKPKDAASCKRVVFAVEIDAGVVASMMEDAPHVGVDSAKIEDIVQSLVDERPDEMALWLLSCAIFSSRNVWARPPRR